MLAVFQVCFFVGLGLTFLSFLFGSIFDIAGIDGLNLDLLDFDIFLPISPVLIFLFLTVFGGTGWILLDTTTFLLPFFIFIISLVVGAVLCWSIYRFIMIPLKKAENTSSPAEEELIGIRAIVTETIFSGGFGEIRYVVNDNSYTAPAKGIKGEEIKTGKDVAICWIKEHVFYVVEMKDI
ncbi:hypothetical protein EDD66_101439 [Mobilisporobacter senegalensis]|uniref:Membrane protein NfeD2 N-terminal transmembrane domain-containing protein n=1 Tax=Mobilisporobacter senegalensis TaxID=1329262 RepID=A0A3N1XYZ6_9FIRM|nr:NfeD family protein [Mobilisporobacter senegalensis]ROR31820.1 hypothetical protein EDD66_101439 [Mobilisporobacter senegalensis]